MQHVFITSILKLQLERTNRKFIKRFKYLETEAKSEGRKLKEMNLDEMNEIWEKAKKFD